MVEWLEICFINIINFQKLGILVLKRNVDQGKLFLIIFYLHNTETCIRGNKVVGIYILNVITYIVLETTYTLVTLLSIYLYLSYIPDYQISSL